MTDRFKANGSEICLSRETLLLFKELLDQVAVKASQPDFEEVCARISRARREFDHALQQHQSPAKE